MSPYDFLLRNYRNKNKKHTKRIDKNKQVEIKI